MYKVYSKSKNYYEGSKYFANTFFGENYVGKTLHVSSLCKFPQVAALKLPTNVIDINSSEMGRFSPLRERDISGPVINSFYQKQSQRYPNIDITVQADPHVNKYDCRGAVSLSSSMQSNVPSPFTGNTTHLNMPGSQWGQGYKYLSDHLHSAHYLTLRNEYRGKMFNKIVTIGIRNMTTKSTSKETLTNKEKLKRAVKEYGATVMVVHICISLLSLGGCYILIESFDVNLMDILKKINLDVGYITSVLQTDAGTFLLAYAVHKCLAPIRVGITLAATPLIVQYLRRRKR